MQPRGRYFRLCLLALELSSALSATMIKFLPLDFLGGSQRILWNAVYRLQIYALVPEIFKFFFSVARREIANNDARADTS